MPTVLINGKSCFYQDLGEGYPILLGHSYLWSSNMWAPQLKILSKEFRCIAVDLWSHGESGSLDAKSYTIEQLANDYWKLMQHLGISEFAVVGLSVGGMWGAHLALKHSEAVKTLVLMDTHLGSEPEVTKQKYFKMLDSIEKAGYFLPTLLDQIVPLFFSPTTLVTQPELALNLRHALSTIKKENISGIVALGRAIFSRKCILNQLRLLKQKTLIIVGKDDIPRPPEEAEEMMRYLNAELHIIEQAGHISNLEKPDRVNSILLNFLRKSCMVEAAF